jgi:thioredoxin-related protein
MSMKKLVIISLIMISNAVAFAQQLEYFKGSWQQANELAARENKFIFVDAYTEWCGWCKVMDKEMFTDPDVIDILKNSFIPMKIDFEDSLGIVLGMKFRVWAYPTTMVFNPYGQLTGKFSGYTDDHTKYLEFLKNNLQIKQEKVFGFDSRELDLPYPEFYSRVFLKGKDRKWPEKSTVTEYLQRQEDLSSEINWSVILRFNPSSFEDHVIQNLEKYSSLYGKDETDDYLYGVIYENIRKAADSSDQASLDKAMNLCAYLEKPEEERVSLMMTYCRMTKDWKGYTDALQAFIDMHGFKDLMTINNSCWTIFENADDKEILLKASEWMKQVIGAEPIWMYLDTYAALLYKSGNLEEALQYADKALQAGEQEKQEDMSSTKELREKIRKSIEGR